MRQKHILKLLIIVIILAQPFFPANSFSQTNPETDRLYSFINSVMYQEYLIYYNIQPGESTRDKWADYSDLRETRLNALYQDSWETLKSSYNYSTLDYQGKLTHSLFDRYLQQQLLFYKYRFQSYAIDHYNGLHARLPDYLIKYHPITTYQEAEAYLAKMDKISDVFEQVIENCLQRKHLGCIPPRNIFPLILDTAANVIKGFPIEIESSQTNILFADFRQKINALTIATSARELLIDRATDILIDDVKPAYQKLINYLSDLEKSAPEKIGVSVIPNGKEYYRMMLAYRTSTDLTPNQVHKLGKRQVRRIKREMKAIMKQLQYPSNKLQDFFVFLRNDKSFYYKNNNKGRNRYLKTAESYLDAMWLRLKDMFITLPKADLIVKPIAAFKEKSTLRAWYTSGSADGTRPGVYNLNLYNMNDQPLFDLESLTYHEGIPGHHLQVSIANEKDFGNYFRPDNGSNTAYVEGWALYSEKMAKEFGAYQDLYSDFGRLSWAMWRACRLVIDTGIHFKNWTRQQAIDYFVKNTPTTLNNCTTEVDRYAIMPAQATAYMIGRLEIEKIRIAAEKYLGDDFDLKKFHDVILTNGPVHLSMLKEIVEDWSDSIRSVSTLYTAIPDRLKTHDIPQWIIKLRRAKYYWRN